MLDKLVYGLTVYKTDEDIASIITKEGLFQTEDVDRLVATLPSFTEFGHVSIEACRLLIPHLKKEGVKYSDACELAGFDIDFIHADKKSYKLAPFNTSQITNPLVKRAISQNRKVINAIIDVYGSHTFINIEFARDLKKTEQQRKEISLQNKESAVKNEAIRKRLIEEFGLNNPTGTDITKYHLWTEQAGKCLLSQKPISASRLFEENYTQPYSRSFNDSYNNKILVLTSENQKKSNLTPFEYFGGDRLSKQWHKYTHYIDILPSMSSSKKSNICRINVPEDHEDSISSFKARDLNDTRYISRFIKLQIEGNLNFADFDKNRRVYVIQGGMTHLLRKRYWFNKGRDLNVRHHAVDAVLVGITTPWMIEKVAKWSSDFDQNMRNLNFPQPWEGFRKDVQVRLMLGEAELNELKKTEGFRSNTLIF